MQAKRHYLLILLIRFDIYQPTCIKMFVSVLRLNLKKAIKKSLFILLALYYKKYCFTRMPWSYRKYNYTKLGTGRPKCRPFDIDRNRKRSCTGSLISVITGLSLYVCLWEVDWFTYHDSPDLMCIPDIIHDPTPFYSGLSFCFLETITAL